MEVVGAEVDFAALTRAGADHSHGLPPNTPGLAFCFHVRAVGHGAAEGTGRIAAFGQVGGVKAQPCSVADSTTRNLTIFDFRLPIADCCSPDSLIS